MLLQQLAPPSVERSDEMREIPMRMNTESPIGFIILRDKFYTRKAEAIVREYCTNANDAMIAAGKGAGGFRVHFPTPVQPTFRVRDYGAGLSFEEMESVFSVYFESNKRTDKKLNGMWGLGCKSAWCKAKEFHIHSFQRGIKSTYLAYEDETRRGKIALLNQEATSEPDGFEVAVPVEPQDFQEFQAAGRRVLRFFRETPLVEGLGEPIRKPDGPLKGGVSDRRWVLTGEESHSGNNTKVSYAVMCEVAYELDRHILAKLSDTAKAIADAGCAIYFPSGSLEITPQREGLELSERNISALERACQRIQQELKGRFDDLIQPQPTLLSAWLAYTDFIRQFPVLANISLEWCGVRLSDLQFARCFCSAAQGAARTAWSPGRSGHYPKAYAHRRLSRLRQRIQHTGTACVELFEADRDTMRFILGYMPKDKLGFDVFLPDVVLPKGSRQPTIRLKLPDFTDAELQAPAYYVIVRSGFLDLPDTLGPVTRRVSRKRATEINLPLLRTLLGRPVFAVKYRDRDSVPSCWEPVSRGFQTLARKLGRGGYTLGDLHDWLTCTSADELRLLLNITGRIRNRAVRNAARDLRRIARLFGLQPQAREQVLYDIAAAPNLPTRRYWRDSLGKWDQLWTSLTTAVPALSAIKSNHPQAVQLAALIP